MTDERVIDALPTTLLVIHSPILGKGTTDRLQLLPLAELVSTWADFLGALYDSWQHPELRADALPVSDTVTWREIVHGRRLCITTHGQGHADQKKELRLWHGTPSGDVLGSEAVERSLLISFAGPANEVGAILNASVSTLDLDPFLAANRTIWLPKGL